MQMMRHTKKPGWGTLFVLGTLFLRALVPAGFMLGSADGRLAVVLCDGEMSVGGYQHQHHPGHDNTPAGHHGAHGGPTCPYAQSAGPAPLLTLPALAHTATIAEFMAPAAVTQTLLPFGPTRRQTPRGPPLLA